MPKVSSPCQRCGVQMEYWPSQERQYCSRQCRAAALAETGMPLKPRRGIDVPCLACDSPVYRMKHQMQRDAFCDVDCKNAWQARNRQVRACGLCGAEFQASASRTTMYCSRACMGAAAWRRPLGRSHNGKPALLDTHGYVRIFEPGHPAATKSGWIFEHRWIVEQALGRHLERAENVHHLNHIRDDNRIENLQLLSHSEHSSVTGRENGEALKAALEARQKLAEYEKLYGPL